MKNSSEMCQPLFLSFDAYELDAGEGSAAPEPVTNHFAAFLLVREGAIRLDLDGEEKTLNPGEAAIFCPGVPHRLLSGEKGGP